MAETMPNMLEMKNITKSFSGVSVLKNIDLSARKGEILALLGENGAGKTTLMNILGGVLQADKGQIFLEGSPADIKDTADAKKYGIAFVHQELNVVNHLRVYENIFLGSEIKKGPMLNQKEMAARSAEILSRLNVTINPSAWVSSLDASYKQVVEIAGALQKNAKLLIMDEPTTALSSVEIETLFNTMRSLKSHGITIIFISHKLGEVLEICDSYCVMRDGGVVARADVVREGADRTTPAQLAMYMVGRRVSEEAVLSGGKPGKEVLRVESLGDGRRFSNINFTVHASEIVGFTGLIGDGRSEMAQCIFGCLRNYHGRIFMNGKVERINSQSKAKRLGIGYIPQNRKENGIFPSTTVKHNISIIAIQNFIRAFIINGRKETEACLKSVKNLNIKAADINNLIVSLSGGNQQKVVLAKWLETDLDLIIFDNPTQGVDVGAKAEIYAIIANLARDGMAVMVLSTEAQEIMRICDRVYVMYQGNINGKLERNEMTEDKIMLMATTPGGGVEALA